MGPKIHLPLAKANRDILDHRGSNREDEDVTPGTQRLAPLVSHGDEDPIDESPMTPLTINDHQDDSPVVTQKKKIQVVQAKPAAVNG